MHRRPQGRGLVQLEATGAGPWSPEPTGVEEPARISSHEFHYAALENVPADAVFAYRVLRGEGIDGRHDGIVIGNLLASFSHLRDTRGYRWTGRFVELIRACKSGRRASTPLQTEARSRQPRPFDTDMSLFPRGRLIVPCAPPARLA